MFELRDLISDKEGRRRQYSVYAEEVLTQYQIKYGGVAQLGEHLPCKQGVRSSILLISTNIYAKSRRCKKL